MFQLSHRAAAEALDRWISWARRCRIPAFVKHQLPGRSGPTQLTVVAAEATAGGGHGGRLHAALVVAVLER